MLPGIIREYLLKTYDVEERRILPEEIFCYEEMFLTNSLLEVMPVKKMGDHLFKSRELSKKILENIQKRESFL